MSRVIVLGGCGVVGSIAVKTLTSIGEFDEIVVADLNYEGAQTCISEIGDGCLSALMVDAFNPDSIKEAIKGSDVVLNCCGPFYKLGPIVLKAVIESGINYV
ncbi:MAG: saccharopine dehydrogenase NADP-binding domain-containing protein, partial [Candidatus Thorarchaeota archaeon]|nr:saccharopine dehydrogenase NADP-binding domain-containing protein [Candidatus Thorarchaeota archaeon]